LFNAEYLFFLIYTIHFAAHFSALNTLPLGAAAPLTKPPPPPELRPSVDYTVSVCILRTSVKIQRNSCSNLYVLEDGIFLEGANWRNEGLI